MEHFETLEKSLCKELEAIEQKLKSGTEMSSGDLDKVDKLIHSLKGLATYRAMTETYGDYENQENMSGRRGRAANGQYISRDQSSQSYADGYSRGYAEGRSQAEYRDMSRHYMNDMPPYDFRNRY